MSDKANLLGVLRTLYQWRKAIAGVVAAAAVGSVVITLLLPNYYQASTLFLASSPDQTKPEVIFGLGQVNARYYGTEDDIDRILTVGESKELVEFLIDSFQLYAHYEIDPEKPKSRTKLEKRLFKHYDLLKTKREAIQLTFEDRDPEFAAALANAARQRIDELGQQLIKSTLHNAIRTLESNIQSKNLIVDRLGDSLQAIRQRYGIYNSEAQTEALSAQSAKARAELIRGRARLQRLEVSNVPKDTITYIKAEVDGRAAEVEALGREIDRLNQGLAQTSLIELQYEDATSTLTNDEERLKRWRAAYANEISSLILIERAVPPDAKSRPVRSLLVIASVAAAFLLSIIGVLLIDSYRSIDWKEVTDEA